MRAASAALQHTRRSTTLKDLAAIAYAQKSSHSTLLPGFHLDRIRAAQYTAFTGSIFVLSLVYILHTLSVQARKGPRASMKKVILSLSRSHFNERIYDRAGERFRRFAETVVAPRARGYIRALYVYTRCIVREREGDGLYSVWVVVGEGEMQWGFAAATAEAAN